MPKPNTSFVALAGVPVHYDRRSASDYGTTGAPRTEFAENDFILKLDACFAELWMMCPHGKARVITTAGAYTAKPGQHGIGRAFDLDGIFWSDRAFVTLRDGYANGDRRFYYAVECILRRHFGQILDYNYNADHRDHFHVDDAEAIGLRTKSQATVSFVQGALRHIHGASIKVDGAWGPTTSGALKQVCSELGVTGDVSDVAVWLRFLELSATRAFASPILLASSDSRAEMDTQQFLLHASSAEQPRAPQELAAELYDVVRTELGSTALRKPVESAIDALLSHPEMESVLSGRGSGLERGSTGQHRPRGVMPNTRELDTRKVGEELGGPNKDASGERRTIAFSSALDQMLRPIDAVTESGLASPDATLKARALALVAAPTDGFAAAGHSEFVPDPAVQRTAAGAAAVHLHQHHQGIPVFQMGQTVRFDPGGSAIDVLGEAANIDPSAPTIPEVAAADAVLIAARHVATTGDGATETDEFGEVHAFPGVDINDFVPSVISGFVLASRPTVFDKGPFENAIPAHLVMFVASDRTRLAWHIVLTFPAYADQYVVVVAADQPDGEILYASSTLHHAIARGRVYEFSPGLGQRRLLDFPRPLSEYPVMPATPLVGFPHDWVATDSAQGNATRATLGASAKTMIGVNANGALTFDPQDAVGDDQKILNIFYFCNYMHDFLFMLGFDEAAGNFQNTNFSDVGSGNDFVVARAHSGAVNGTANMATGPDGLPPVMNMGLVTSTNRHTAFDSDVVFHEFAHGLTNRLVGGPLDTGSLESRQSRGMGEGWSDFFALTVQNFFAKVEKVVTGDWVVQKSGGIRSAPYDDQYPRTYADLKNLSGEHAVGEVWCATLLMIVRRMAAALGDKPSAYRLTWQIVVDGLKLTPSNPTFLQGRDAILLALRHLRDAGRIQPGVYKVARRAAWESFARFGMGVNARSADAGNVSDIAADTTLPTDL